MRKTRVKTPFSRYIFGVYKSVDCTEISLVTRKTPWKQEERINTKPIPVELLIDLFKKEHSRSLEKLSLTRECPELAECFECFALVNLTGDDLWSLIAHARLFRKLQNKK